MVPTKASRPTKPPPNEGLGTAAKAGNSVRLHTGHFTIRNDEARVLRQPVQELTAPPRAARRNGRGLTARQHNLPTSRIQLIGREQDSTAVRDEALHGRGRLVTLTGPGGCGKTQLALHVAAELVGTFPDGVWLVDLPPVQAGQQVPSAVAAALKYRERAGETIVQTLAAKLGDRELLLVP